MALFRLFAVIVCTLLAAPNATVKASPQGLCSNSAQCPFADGGDSQSVITVNPLRYADIPRAVDTVLAAFADDPLIGAYEDDTPDSGGKRPNGLADRIAIGISFAAAMSEKTCAIWTVEKGHAMVLMRDAKSVPRGPMDKFLDKVYLYVTRIRGYLLTPQQRERRVRVESEFKACVEAIGPGILDMVHLDILATHPAYQGKGHGGALVDTVTAFADAAGRATFLISSNVNNTSFYELHGFVVIADVLVGDDDPTWDKEPFVIKAMVRKPFSEKLIV